MYGRNALPTMLRGILAALVGLAWMAAADDARAAKDKSMCDGLSGSLKGWCTAAASLGCGVDGKHAKTCDALADKFEGVAGAPPPWEDPVDPPPTVDFVDLILDSEGFDLDADIKCPDYVLGNVCPGPVTDDTDFWATVHDVDDTLVVLVLTTACTDIGAAIGVKVIPLPFSDVDVLDVTGLESGVTEVALGANDTMIIRTCGDNYFKVGNRSFGTGTVRLEYEQFAL